MAKDREAQRMSVCVRVFCLPSVCSHPDKWALNMLQSLSVSQTNTFIVIADLFYDYVSTWFQCERIHTLGKLNINQANGLRDYILRKRNVTRTRTQKIKMKSNGKFTKDYVLDNRRSKLLFHKYFCYIHFLFQMPKIKRRETKTLPLNTCARLWMESGSRCRERAATMLKPNLNCICLKAKFSGVWRQSNNNRDATGRTNDKNFRNEM